MMFWCLSCSATTVNGITRQMVTFHCEFALFLLWLVISDHESHKEFVGRALCDRRFLRFGKNLRPEAEKRGVKPRRKQQRVLRQTKRSEAEKQ